MHLQNVVMQLRKVCSHPILFEGPRMHQQVMDEELVDASGKMMVLERLLDALFARGHKVLVFSQFVTMLDVIEVSRIPFFAWSRLTYRACCYGRTGRTSAKAGHCAASMVPQARWIAVQRWTASRRAETRQTHRGCSS